MERENETVDVLLSEATVFYSCTAAGNGNFCAIWREIVITWFGSGEAMVVI